MLVDKSWSHQVGSLENELDCSLIGCETGVHVRVGVDDLERRYAVVVSMYKMSFLVDNDVLCLIISTFELIDVDFGFLGEEDVDLLFWEFGPFYKACSEFLDSGLAGNLFVS